MCSLRLCNLHSSLGRFGRQTVCSFLNIFSSSLIFVCLIACCCQKLTEPNVSFYFFNGKFGMEQWECKWIDLSAILKNVAYYLLVPCQAKTLPHQTIWSPWSVEKVDPSFFLCLSGEMQNISNVNSHSGSVCWFWYAVGVVPAIHKHKADNIACQSHWYAC